MSGYNSPKDAIVSARLTRPIRVLRDEVDEIYFREARFGDLPPDLDLADEGAILRPACLMHLTQRLANLSPKQVASIAFADFPAIAQAVAEALGPFDDLEETEQS